MSCSHDVCQAFAKTSVVFGSTS